MNRADDLRSLARRFLAKQEPVPGSECVRWTGAATPQGYGTLRVPRWLVPCGVGYAHRVAYFLQRAVYPERGVDVDHLCHHRWCVNPGHLRGREEREHRAKAPVEARVYVEDSDHEFFF